MGESRDEDFLTKKMEEMRKKNEEILRRHQEVEEDKIYADQFSKSAKERRKNMDPEKIIPRATSVRKQHNKTPSAEMQANNNFPKETEERRQHRFSESDGPPPDPNFNFLSDPSRKRNSSSSEGNWRDAERDNSSVWGQSRRHHTNYGGPDFKNVKSTIERHKLSYKKNQAGGVQNAGDLTMQMTGKQRIQYEEWKKEREKVDQARIDRQRRSDGLWRREWDSHKTSNDKSGDEDCDHEEEDPHHSFQYQKLSARNSDFTNNTGGFSHRSQMQSANDNERSTRSQRIFRPSGKGSRVISDGDGRLSITLTNRAAGLDKPTERKKMEVGSPRTKSSSWTFLVSEPSISPPVSSSPQVPKPLYPGWQVNKEKGILKESSQGSQDVKVRLDDLQNHPWPEPNLSEKYQVLPKNIHTVEEKLNSSSDIYYSDEEKADKIEDQRIDTTHVQEVKCKFADLKIDDLKDDDDNDDEWEDVTDEEVG